MAANTDFFKGISAQAVLKHRLLASYAHYFAIKAGKATRGKVAFIDGYAGEGRYEDGSLGSPLLLASSSERAATFGRDVRLAFVELDDARRERLKSTLAEHNIVPDQLVGGTFDSAVHRLLDRNADRATLVFADPFGLALDRDVLESVISQSIAGRPVDVLLHFSLLSVARMAPADRATSNEGEVGPNARKLDAALGDIDWRAEFDKAVRASATARAMAVAEDFASAVSDATGARHTSIEVRQRPGHLPKYLLILFCKLDEAHWNFADMAGKAHVDWLHHCSREDFLASVASERSIVAPSLFDAPEPEPDRSTAESRVGEIVRHALPTHLKRLLRDHGSLRFVDHIAEVYGDQLGMAREMHLRTAVKQLHREGLIDDNGTGDFHLRTISWTGPT